MKPHGLKGQVTIALDPEAPEDLKSTETLYLDIKGKLLPYFIESISLKGNKAFLKLEGVDTPEEAQLITRSAIYRPRSSRPKSRRDEFYEDEIVGFEVTDTHLGPLGRITEVVHAGANRLLCVKEGSREILIPLNGPFVGSINKTKKRISVTLPEGFLDINPESS
ncbi:MAG: ribosome maturation factor RimM [Bacteroidota bacterium]|nr:ribosome maturation factor RimM [Bacteroidota bacterium]